MKYILISVLTLLFFSCNQKESYYAKQHDKYRTFWYRTNLRCYYDSSKKYGDLYDSIRGHLHESISVVDTLTINEPANNCK